VLAALSPAGTGVDELVRRAGLPASAVGPLLTGLAIRGRVHALPGGLWQPATP
jgi:DNA-binding IclR family transcriptional regulator